MTEFSNYMKAIIEKEAAYQQYCYAGAKLTNATIMERFYEIQSQHAPAQKLVSEIDGLTEDQKESVKKAIFNIAKYVVSGRKEWL